MFNGKSSSRPKKLEETYKVGIILTFGSFKQQELFGSIKAYEMVKNDKKNLKEIQDVTAIE